MRALRGSDLEALLECRLDAVQQLVDPGLQPRVFMHQRVAHQNPRQAAILLREAQQ
jgi:hypothetical protein